LLASGKANQLPDYTPIYDTYTFRGNEDGETWGPKFFYHGLRYLEVRGLPFRPTPDMFIAKSIRSATDKVGEFRTSNELLNEIDTIITRAMESNIYNTITDCPHYEKLGWLDVPNLLFNSLTAIYDMSAWMPKVALDTNDSQLDDGLVPTTAPEHTIFSENFRKDPTWSAAAIMVPWQSYTTYGDVNQLNLAYPTMTKLMDYFASRSSGYLLNYGLGDWGAYDQTTTVGFTVSCTYYQVASVMSQIAKILGKTSDETNYKTLAKNIKNALNTKYFISATNKYDSGSQAANAMALYYGIVSEEKKEAVLQNLIKSVKETDYHLTTGEIALKPLFLSLAQNGYNDIVYTMATRKTMPSYGYFIERGATTLPEFWDMHRSQNHCMMGHIEGWFYEQLAGIRNDDIAFKKMKIEPFFPYGLNSIDISTQSVYGKIRSAWKRNDDYSISTQIEVPANTTATVYFPLKNVSNITEGGYLLADVPIGILSYALEYGKIKIEVASGKYNFKLMEVPVSFSNVELAISKAERNIQSNVMSGWNELQEALLRAKTILGNVNAVQREIDETSLILEAATRNLVLKNIALKKTLLFSTSFEQSGWGAAKLVDGDISASSGYSSSSTLENHTEWVGVDFGYAYDFNQVKLYPRNIGISSETFPVDFEIQISNDGDNWTTVHSETNYPAPTPPSTVQTFNFSPVKAQFIRIYANKLRPFSAEGNKYYLQLVEIEVFKK